MNAMLILLRWPISTIYVSYFPKSAQLLGKELCFLFLLHIVI